MNNKQLFDLICETLEYCKMTVSSNVVQLILGTICQESACGEYLKQIKGPACGICQIEPNTAKDIINNYILKRANLFTSYSRLYNKNLTLEQNLCYNLMFSIFMCRVFYLRFVEKIPDTLEGQARYWKKYYNTSKGKGTVEQYITNYRRFDNV